MSGPIDWETARERLEKTRGKLFEGDSPPDATGNEAPPEKVYNLLTFDDLAELPPMRWKVKGVLPDTGIAAIYGPSGSGKSFLSLDLAGALGAGREWFGHRVNPAPVVYLCLEGESGLRNRVAAYRTHHGGDSLANVRFIVESFNMLNEDPAALIRTVRAAGMESPVVFIDTLNRAAPGADENSGVDMGKIIAAAKVIQGALGGLVILVHHTGKDTGKGLRGHSSLHAALDAAISVDRNEFGRGWTASKVKDGIDGGKRPFELKIYELGTDEDGDPVTSCAILPGDPVDHASGQQKPKTPKGDNQKIVWSYIQETFKDRTAIPLEEVIEGVRGRLTVEEKRKSERARLAVASLVSSGFVTLEHDILSLPIPVPISHPPKGGSGKMGNGNSQNVPKWEGMGKWESATDGDTEEF